MHLVTFGLSELFAKESEVTDVSGWGIELTFRLAGEWTAVRPDWALDILARMANQVDERGDPLEPGDRIDVGGPLRPHTATALTALALTTDPQLGTLETPNGRVRFLQVVGLTGDELDLARRWRTEAVLSALAERDPLMVTDLGRRSILAVERVRLRLEYRAQTEGPA